MTDVLTVSEVATFLRSEPEAVVERLTSGSLAGFRIGDEWRILEAALLDFLKKAMEDEQLRALETALHDPKAWARATSNDPEFAASIEKTDYAPGTFGAWLKQGFDALRAEGEGKVVDITTRLRD